MDSAVTAWESAKARFMEGLPEPEQVVFNKASLETLFYSTSVTAKSYESNSRVQMLRKKLQPMIESILGYATAMDCFAQISPLVLCPIWGSIRVLLHIAQGYSKYFDKLVEMFARIGDVLPRFQGYELLFPKHAGLRLALSRAYFTVIEFCVDAKAVFVGAKKSSVGWVTIKTFWRPFARRFDQYLSDLRSHQSNSEKEVALCHMIEEKEARELQKQDQAAKRRQKILTWLSMLDNTAQHRRLQKLRHEGTGSWLSELPKFRSWLDGQNSSCFCCFGIPGSGKTILASSLIDSISPVYDETTSSLCYHYCTYTNVASLDIGIVFGTLIRQLLERIDIPPPIYDAIEKYYNEGSTKPSLDEMTDILTMALTRFTKVMLILDGLDELAVEGQVAMINCIHRLVQLPKTVVKIITLSRREERLIRQTFVTTNMIDISKSLVRKDLERFITDSVNLRLQEGKLKLRDPKLKYIIILTLLRGAVDMFLWVKFQLEEICESLTDDEIRRTLRDLPRNLADTYARILNRYCAVSGGKSRARVMRKVFPWIACAKRPLTIEELNEAYSVEVTDSHLHREKIPTDNGRILEACGSLVIFDKDDHTVIFAHHTVKDYILGWSPSQRHGDRLGFVADDANPIGEETRSHSGVADLFGEDRLQFTPEEADLMVGKSCITYLCFNDFERQLSKLPEPSKFSTLTPEFVQGMAAQIPGAALIGSAFTWLHGSKTFTGVSGSVNISLPNTGPPLANMEDKYRLLNYIVAHWFWHTSQFSASNASNTWTRFRSITFQRAVAFDMRPWKAIDLPTNLRRLDFPGLDVFRWAVDMNLPCFLDLVLEIADKKRLEKYMSTRTDEDLNPLVRACQKGCVGSLQWMLEQTTKSQRESLDLPFHAASSGQRAVLRLLLDRKAVDVDVYSLFNLAAKNGDHALFKLLHDRADNPISDKKLVWRAAEEGDLALIRLILRRSDRTVDAQELLHSASEQGNILLVKTLLDQPGVKVDQESDGRTPLSRAAELGEKEVVELLLKRGSTATHRSRANEETPLCWAAKNGHDEVVKVLCPYGDVDQCDLSGQTPLFWAAKGGFHSVVAILLKQTTVNANVQGPDDDRPLIVASRGGHLRVVDLLLKKGHVNVNVQDKNGRTALSFAADSGYKDMVKTLLGQPYIEPDKKDSVGRTPLLYAASKGHELVVKQLLARSDVNLNTRDGETGQTCLSWALERNHQRVAMLILNRSGVNADVKDFALRTPLSRVAEKGRYDLVKLLLARDEVEADSKDNKNRTPLSYAAGTGALDVVKLMLQEDSVCADSRDDGGRTPLFWAAENGHSPVVRTLLAHDNVNIDIKDNLLDNTPLETATLLGHEGVVKEFKRHRLRTRP